MKARTDNWCQNNNENINSIYLEWKLDFQHYFPSFLNVYNVTERCSMRIKVQSVTFGSI